MDRCCCPPPLERSISVNASARCSLSPTKRPNRRRIRSSKSKSTPAVSPAHTRLRTTAHTACRSGNASTTGTKHHLRTIQHTAEQLTPTESIEGLVTHDIKELGQHALVCTVTYGAQTSRSFRKVYKFDVANPLSVRTKAHSPSPNVASSFLSEEEGNKVFMELQVENKSATAMHFHRMQFEPVDGWDALDLNSVVHSAGTPELDPAQRQAFFAAPSESILPPEAVRQYLFVLTPRPGTLLPLPGSSQALGRLNIRWYGPGGENGNLTTSVLGRKVPLITPGSLGLQFLERENATLAEQARGRNSVDDGSRRSLDVRPGSPAVDPTLSRTPAPYRPSNLSKSTSTPLSPQLNSSTGMSRSSSATSTSYALLPPTLATVKPDANGLEFELRLLPLGKVTREEVFGVEMKLIVRQRSQVEGGKRRRIRVAIQHVDHWSLSATKSTPARQVLVLPRLPSPNPRQSMDTVHSVAPHTPSPTSILLPHFAASVDAVIPPSKDIVRVGPSLLHLPDILLDSQGSAASNFRLDFLSLASGLFRVGGVRVLLLENELLDAEASEGTADVTAREGTESDPFGSAQERNLDFGNGDELEIQREARVVYELGVIAEVWVGR